MAVITLQDVSKLYGFGDATTVALEDVSLSIEKGEFVAVMGPSGSGKSTLMNMIGLLDRPTHGIYRLDGRSVERLRPDARSKARRDKIGFVFQSPSFLPRLTIIENVALPLAYKGKGTVKRLKAAHAMLERVGLGDRAYYLPRQLSGGQLQRATLARALINEPNIIIADEPTGNLDSASSRLVMELISDIHKMGNTVLMVTHNPELTRYASRVLYMYDGSIAHDEQKELGEIAPEAEARTSIFPEQTAEEDDLAGVSVLMGVDDTTTTNVKKRTTAKKKTKSKAKITRNKKRSPKK